MADVTELISSGSTLLSVKSRSSTSTTKTKPAMGALKIPAIAPAAPHPTRSISWRCSSLKSRPVLLPMAAPVITIGDSAPTDPPKPIVIELARSDDHVLCGLIRLLRCDIAPSTFVTPWLMSSRMNSLTTPAVSRTPIGGRIRYHTLAWRMAGIRRCCIVPINCLSAKAARAVKIPMIKDKISTKMRSLM